MMTRLLFCLAFCLLLAGQAAADGKFFSASNDVRQPDQKGLLWHEEGRETLLLQVKYEGAAGDFGWVVPVPGRPKLDTASSEIFFELADITKPVHVSPWWAPRSSQFVAGVGGIAGVSVVEQAQVGPYDATVLAATRAGALAAWLKEHSYEMPPGAARVLKSYVDRGWYYVALRINAQRVYDQLLADLQQLDPEIESLEDAPDRLASLVLRTADASPKRGRELLARLTAIADKAQSVPEDLEAAWRRDWVAVSGMAHGAGLLGSLDKYYTWRRGFFGDAVSRDDALTYATLAREGAGGGDEEAMRAATAFGIDHDGTLRGFEDALAAALREDLARDVVWKESRVARLLDELMRPGGGGFLDSAFFQLRDDYQTRRMIIQEHAGIPPCDHHRSRDLRGGAEVALLSRRAKWADAATRLEDRERLWSHIRSAVALSAEALETALNSGSIAPLRLEFDCDELVYPLYLTSLNGAAVDLQVYVLSDHRMTADGFDTTFAGRLDSEVLDDAPETAKLVTSGRDYLTELRAKLAPEEMTADLFFSQARTDAPYREEIVRGGAIHPLIILLGTGLLLAALAVIWVIYNRVRHALARRRS